jgi:hypothetical protein
MTTILQDREPAMQVWTGDYMADKADLLFYIFLQRILWVGHQDAGLKIGCIEKIAGRRWIDEPNWKSCRALKSQGRQY